MHLEWATLSKNVPTEKNINYIEFIETRILYNLHNFVVSSECES